MATITKWSGVAVTVQTALAVAKTITAITKASPAVVSSTAHGYSNGDYILMAAQGMWQVNYRAFRVASVATDSFALEGVDSTNFATFVSGSCQKVTLGASISTLTDVSASGGEAGEIDVTTIHDLQRVTENDIPSASVFSFQSIWDPADAGLAELKKANDEQGSRVILFAYPNGKKLVFNAGVSAPLNPTGSAQDVVKTPITFRAKGSAMAYST